MVGTCVAVVLLGVGLPGLVVPAGADQISATRDQIGALQAAVVAGATRIRQLTVAYQEASVQADTLSQQVSADRVQFGQLQAQLAGTEVSLRHEAIVSYVGGYRGVPATGRDASGQAATDPSVRAVYIGLAASDLQDVVDQYRLARAQVASAAATLAAQERASQTAAAAVDQVRLAALNEAVSEQAQVNALQGRLTQLVTAAAAAQAAQAARAARAAAAAETARAAEPATGTGQSKPLPAVATQGLPVNNGIVTVVRTVVGSAAAPASPPAAAPAAGPKPTAPPATAAPPVPTPTTTATTVPPPPTTAPPAPPPPRPAPAPPSSAGGAGGVWLQLRECESGDNYQENTGNGFYGAYQFSQQTWSGLGYPGRPDLEPPSAQDQAAMKLQAEQGWGPWPACAAALGLL